jgi:hypothetical protein
MLLPRELDMIAAGKQMPLPLSKPKISEVEVEKYNGRGTADDGSLTATRPGRQAAPAPLRYRL